MVSTTDRTRNTGIVAWAAAVLFALGLNIVDPAPDLQGAWQWLGGLMAFPVAAVVVLTRTRTNTIGRVLAFIATTAALDVGIVWAVAAWPGRWAAHAQVLSVVLSIGHFAGILSLLHVFPTGRSINRLHRRFLVTMNAWFAVTAGLTVVAPGPIAETTIDNPLGVAPSWTADVVDVAVVMLPIGALVGVVALLGRYRQADPVQRAQLRWFFTGAAALTATFAIITLLPEDKSPSAELLISFFALASFWSLPAAIVVAITRYRLYEIDQVLSRTVSYLVVAGILTVVYLGSILGLQWVLPVENSPVAVAAATLAAAAFFAPARRIVQQRIDHRFNRARYEARAVTAEFARRLQREIDVRVIEHDLADVVARTVHPAQLQLWLRR